MAWKYEPEHFTFIRELREDGMTWPEVAEEFNEQFDTNKSESTLKNSYNTRMQMIETGKEELDVEILKSLRSARKTNTKNNKINNLLLDHLNGKQDLLDEISKYVKEIKFPKSLQTKKATNKKTKKRDMTMELLLSDIHFGKKTDTFDLAVCRDRLTQLTDVFVKEFHLENKAFNVHRILLNLAGDLIENHLMHGMESMRGCEFPNSRQVVEAIDGIFNLIIVPLSKLGVQIDVTAITGNHSRDSEKKTMHLPGESHLSYIIYKALEGMCVAAEIKNISFNIPKKNYAVIDIYGDKMLLEHLDQVKAFSIVALEALLNKRQQQLGHIIAFLRGGHWHSYLCIDRGRIIVNESVCGQDSFAEVMGFNSHAGQTINYYIETSERPNCFYKSFPVYLR